MWSDLVRSGPNFFKTLKKGKNTDKRHKNDVFGEKIIISINYLINFDVLENRVNVLSNGKGIKWK